MKLDTPEAKAFVKLWVDYDPQVGFDLHTSDGSAHGYYLTYSPPLNPDTEPGDHEDHDGRVVPVRDEEHEGEARLGLVLLRQRLDSGRRRAAAAAAPAAPPAPRHGGQAAAIVRAAAATPATPPQPAGPREWRTFEHVPRFHNNYVGLRNRFALLSEAYAYATFEDRIKATNYFMEEALELRAPERRAAEEGRRRRGPGEARRSRCSRRRAKFKRGGMVEILMGEVEDETNPVNGAVMNRRKDVVKPEQMVDMMWFEPATTETVPSAYYVPADADEGDRAAEGARHPDASGGQPPVTDVEQFAIDSQHRGADVRRARDAEARRQVGSGAGR